MFKLIGRLSVGLTIVMLAVLPMLAKADTILYEHPFDSASGALCSPCYGPYRVWDVFDLAADSTVTEVQARLDPDLGYLAPIEFSIWTADRVTELFSQSFLWGELSATPFSDIGYDVTAKLPSWDLTAGSYSLSIFGLGPNSGILGWYYSAATVDGRGFQTFDFGIGSGHDMQFRILGDGDTGQVPVPATLALFGLALAALIYSRRKRITS